MATITAPVKDKAIITEDGERLAKVIAGLNIRKLTHIEDHRGVLTEVYRPSWGQHPDPLVYIYQVVARPGSIRGWVVHKKQDDRIFSSTGVLHWALYDDREDSPTYQMLNQFTFSERTPAVFTIPKGVYHAVKNVGTTDAIFFNMPNRPYDHADPDKYRLPIKNDLIPFSF